MLYLYNNVYVCFKTMYVSFKVGYLDVLLLLKTFFHFLDLLLLFILGDDGQLWDPCLDTLLVTGSVEDTCGTCAGIDVASP